MALRRAHGARPIVLAVGIFATGLTCALSAWVGARLLAELAPAARALFGAGALAIAGAEMALLKPRAAPAEPTHSLFAAWLVVLGLQATDAARFLVLALAVSTAAPVGAALGGAAGSGAALALGWGAPEWVDGRSVAGGRRAGGLALLLLGLALVIPNVIGFSYQ